MHHIPWSDYLGGVIGSVVQEEATQFGTPGSHCEQRIGENQVAIMAPTRGTRTLLMFWRAEQADNPTNSTLTKQSPSPASEAQSTVGLDPALSSSTSEVCQTKDNLLQVLPEDLDFDTMSYPYPKYIDSTNGESHVRSFLSTWKENHAIKCFAVVEAESSKIAEFTLSRFKKRIFLFKL